MLYVRALFLNSVVVIVSYLRLRGFVCGFCFAVLYACCLVVGLGIDCCVLISGVVALM